jgi:pimeloyl-ACP methyl ester carboxylesterase
MLVSARFPMPFITIDSRLAGRAAEIHYRQTGEGVCLCFLHGGWGYEVYPLDRQREAIQGFQVIVPDRSGYGRSTKPAVFTIDFHRCAAEETLRCLDALGIRRCILWGHSDGAVIAAWLGLMAPERCLGLILEALHYYRDKPRSRAFFEAMASAPESFGGNVGRVLASEHGEPYWRELMRSEGQVWLDIARSASDAGRDLYDGRLSELTVPTLVVHGACDPRTEPGELDAVRRELAPQQANCRLAGDPAPASRMHIIENGGHSPHSEEPSAAECSRVVREALALWSARK